MIFFFFFWTVLKCGSSPRSTVHPTVVKEVEDVEIRSPSRLSGSASKNGSDETSVEDSQWTILYLHRDEVH